MTVNQKRHGTSIQIWRGTAVHACCRSEMVPCTGTVDRRKVDLEWITILVDLILGFIDGLLLGSARLLLPECLTRD